MWVIGIVGGIASGKSTVAEQFRQLGAEVIHADLIGHEVLRDAQVQRLLFERWGKAVLDQKGEVDRAAVAKIVFTPSQQSAGELKFLEQTTHPLIGQRVEQQLADLARREGLTAVVLDAPVLFKAGWDVYCDKIVFVETTRSARRERARRRGWSEAEFAAREAAQESLDEKRIRADWVIDNSGCPEDTFVQIQRFWRSLK